MENYILEARSSDVTPLFAGREACEPGHSFGPFIRDCYLIHFCLSGRGILKNKDGMQKIVAGQFFVIRPGEITTYTADMKEPWEYTWIAFRSDESFFTGNRSVFDTPHELDRRLTDILGGDKLSICGCLAVIHGAIWESEKDADEGSDGDRVRSIRRYIKYNYMLPITVSSISSGFGFDRSYLYRVFKSRYGIGIKEYIISVRMEKAREFLRAGYSVKNSAHMVGYDDEFNFSKTFKARYGVSPSKTKR